MKNSVLAAIALCFLISSSVFAASEGDTTTINVSGVLLDTPDCTVNGNNSIDVDFGDDVVISRIDGLTYKKTQLIYSLVCTSLAKQGLTVTVKGTPASFNSQLIATDKEGLGIQMLLYGAIPIGPGTAMNFDYSDTNSNAVNLWAVLSAQSGATLTATDFSGAGTLVFGYQ